MSDLTKKHPEQMDDEIFLCNASHEKGEYEGDSRSSYQCIGWKTKRAGRIAYDVHGKVINDVMFPVFVKIKEIKDGDPKVAESLLKGN